MMFGMGLSEILTRWRVWNNQGERKVFTAEEMWSAVDSIAEMKSISRTKLAEGAGIEPTSFHPTKRKRKQGEGMRFMSTDAINRLCESINVPVWRFVRYIEEDVWEDSDPSRVPRVHYSNIDETDDPFSSAERGEAPSVVGCYVIDIDTYDLAPCYSFGDRIYVTPVPDEEIGRELGKKVIVNMTDGTKHMGILAEVDAKTIALIALFGKGRQTFQVGAVASVHKIVMASQ